MALTQRESVNKLNDIKSQQKANAAKTTLSNGYTPGTTTVTNADGTKTNYSTGTPSSSGGGSSSSNINSGYNFNQADYLKQMSTGINSLYDNQTQAEVARLRASQQKALGQINQQKAEVKPMYADKRNQSDVVSNQNVQKLRELMASNGLQASGENVTANVGLQNARQSALNGLNLQEQQTMNDFNRQINDVTDPSQEQALINSLEAQRAQALLDAGIRADDRGYQVGRDNVADNQWNTQFNYQQGRDSVADNQWNTQFNYGKSVDDRNYNYQVGRDAVGDKQWQAGFDEQKRLADYNNYRRQYEYNNLSASEKEQKRLADYNNYRRQYEYNNMSKSEQAAMDWSIKQHGEDAAWRMYEMEYNGNLALSQNQAEIDAYTGDALDFLP